MSKLTDIMTAPWAILPDMLREIGGIYATHLRGDKIDLKAVEAQLGRPLDNEPDTVDVIDGVAVISAHGVIAKRMNMFSRISGGVSTEILSNQIHAALASDDVHSIVLDIDSPGGTVDGTFELADAIYNARGQKPVIALANGLMASAAYAIGSAADAVYMTGDTTHVGSIGVVASHTDYSKAEEIAGIKTTEIYAGKFKRIASQHEPLSEEGRASIQDSVDYLYSVFVERVAQFRSVSVGTVLDDMADGRLFIGQQAIDAGLVDGVSTLPALINALNNGTLPAQRTAQLDAGVVSTDETLSTIQEDSDMELKDITTGFVAEHCPDVAEAFRAEGAAAARDEGATAERERIQGVLAQSMPGHEALIQSLAFDGKTTGPEAAVQVLQAEKANTKTTAAGIDADAKKLDAVGGTVDAGVEDSTSIDHLPFNERCEHKWKHSASLRAEFAENYDRFVAFEKANARGSVHVLSK